MHAPPKKKKKKKKKKTFEPHLLSLLAFKKNSLSQDIGFRHQLRVTIHNAVSDSSLVTLINVQISLVMNYDHQEQELEHSVRHHRHRGEIFPLQEQPALFSVI